MERLSLPPSGGIPNNPRLPVLIYWRALKVKTAAQAEAALASQGWTNSWQNGIYSFHHYHSTAHEVLVVVRGQTRVTLGGEGGPQVQLQAGDVVLLPAGTGHRNDGSSPDLLVVGAYAGGRDWDVCRPEETDMAAAQRRIAAVPDWEQEPV
ncbi:cupin domain-containing protein [Deinococcus fonticola]|uniref:cupin domain-containing protein n=1 Tax=Deinococcus fonticola TaxID=2528713 RepID=UPI001F0D7577|nr:cupin domain-containing protein [Deinococcus fonticola]